MNTATNNQKYVIFAENKRGKYFYNEQLNSFGTIGDDTGATKWNTRSDAELALDAARKASKDQVEGLKTGAGHVYIARWS